MPTQCSQEELDFGSCGGRKLVGAFDGGAITSNGGALLLGAADRSIRLTDRLAKCFRDLRLADGITHTDWIVGRSARLVSAIWNSNSKSDTARSPRTITWAWRRST